MSQRNVGFLGLGGMGTGMARRLVEAGHVVRVYNRTAEKAAPLVAVGARPANSAAEAVRDTDTVVVSLADEPAVERVLFADAAPSLDVGALVIDTSTVSPSFSRDAALRLDRLGVRRVEACVFGNPLQANAGELHILAAGDPADIDAVRDVLDAIGQDVRYFGPTGAAATMKLALNTLIGAEIAAMAEAVALAQASGLDRDDVLACISESGVSSLVMKFRAEIMRAGRYEPAAFRARLMAKDLHHALEHARDGGATLPLTGRVLELLDRVIESGDGDKDLAVLAEHAIRNGATFTSSERHS